MPATLEEVKQVIQTEFPGSDVDDVKEENHRVLGTIVWNGFKGKDSRERNRLVTEKVRNRLGLRGINVGILFPLAPGEKL
jgi:acid stress-induced BolA-like protein IbaG/YrbA